MSGNKKFLFCFLVIAVIFLFFPSKVFAQVVINEFSACSEPDWVEIYNTSQDIISLSEWQIRDNTTSNKIDLSGLICPESFRTFDFSNRLNKGGDEIRLLNNNNVIDEVKYFSDLVPKHNNSESTGREIAGASQWIVFGNPTPENDQCVFSSAPTPLATLTPTLTPRPTPILTPTLTPTLTSIPTSVPMPTLTLTLTPTPTLTLILTPTPTENEGVFKIKTIRNEAGEELNQVKIYIDDQYIHHWAPEDLVFGSNHFCDDAKEIDCYFGEHKIILKKSGYQDWSVVEEIKAGDDYEINPVLVAEITPTIVPSAVTYVSTASGNENTIITDTISSGDGLADQPLFKSFKNKMGLVLGDVMDFSRSPTPTMQEEKPPSDFSHHSIISDWVFLVVGGTYCFWGIGAKLVRNRKAVYLL